MKTNDSVLVFNLPKLQVCLCLSSFLQYFYCFLLNVFLIYTNPYNKAETFSLLEVG